MDIAAITMGMNQSNSKVLGMETIGTFVNPVKENDEQIIAGINNTAINPNIGQKLDVIAGEQKDMKEELNKKQQQEMNWVQEKQKMMSIKETKMLQMREISDQSMQSKLTPQELKKLDDRIGSLAAQISAIDSDSSRTKDGKVLE